MNKAIFFDRDGIVNERLIGKYVKNISEFVFVHSFLHFFAKIKENNYLAILITNQQGIGKGLMSEDDLGHIHHHMQTELKRKTGYNFDDIYFSPDLADSGSKTRKPAPGMILKAAEKWNIDLKSSFMVGDSSSDIQAGINAGTSTILINKEKAGSPDLYFQSLDDLYLYFSENIL